MNKFIAIAIIVFTIQVMTWGCAWGCLNPDVISGDWFGLSKETIVNNTFTVFWICLGVSLVSTAVLVGSGVHLWIKNIYEVVEKLQREKK